MTKAPQTSSIHPSRNQQDPPDGGAINMQERIRQRAYELYEKRGRHEGHQLEDWTRAEEEVRSGRETKRAA